MNSASCNWNIFLHKIIFQYNDKKDFSCSKNCQKWTIELVYLILMVLIKSISGIRGTLGNDENSLNPTNLSRFVYAFSLFLIEKYGSTNIAIAVGRDGRESGEMFLKIVNDTLSSKS